MVEIKIKSSTSYDADRLQELIHDALKGTPAYVNSEIVLSPIDNNLEFSLIVGNNSRNDLYLETKDVTIIK